MKTSLIFILVLLFVAGAAPRKWRGQRKERSLVNFAVQIECLTGRAALDYNGYGCWCGRGGSGVPVDDTDSCCKRHDACYGKLKSSGTCTGLQLYLQSYQLSRQNCRTSSASITCGKGTRCQVGLCRCDKEAANCFRTANFDSAYKYYDKYKC